VESSRVTVGLSGRTLYHGVSKLSESQIECFALVNKFFECKQSLRVFYEQIYYLTMACKKGTLRIFFCTLLLLNWCQLRGLIVK